MFGFIRELFQEDKRAIESRQQEQEALRSQMEFHATLRDLLLDLEDLNDSRIKELFTKHKVWVRPRSNSAK